MITGNGSFIGGQSWLLFARRAATESAWPTLSHSMSGMQVLDDAENYARPFAGDARDFAVFRRLCQGA